jgi:hypothetical protein
MNLAEVFGFVCFIVIFVVIFVFMCSIGWMLSPILTSNKR